MPQELAQAITIDIRLRIKDRQVRGPIDLITKPHEMDAKPSYRSEQKHQACHMYSQPQLPNNESCNTEANAKTWIG